MGGGFFFVLPGVPGTDGFLGEGLLAWEPGAPLALGGASANMD